MSGVVADVFADDELGTVRENNVVLGETFFGYGT